MPPCNLTLAGRREQRRLLKLNLLREAAQVGIVDIENGRCRTFATRDALSDHLRSLTKEAIRRASH